MRPLSVTNYPNQYIRFNISKLAEKRIKRADEFDIFGMYLHEKTWDFIAMSVFNFSDFRKTIKFKIRNENNI